MHRDVRRIGDQRAVGIEDRAGEVEPLLDIDAGRGRLKRDAHFLGDGHEKVVENLEPDGIDVSADRLCAIERHGAGKDERTVARSLGLPTSLDYDRRGGFEDKGWAFEHFAGVGDLGHHFRTRRSPPDRLDDERIDNDLGALFPIAEPPTVKISEDRAHLLCGANADLYRGVASRRPKSRAADQLDAFPVKALLDQRLARPLLQCRKHAGKILAERLQPARFADRLHVGDADAKG